MGAGRTEGDKDKRERDGKGKRGHRVRVGGQRNR